MGLRDEITAALNEAFSDSDQLADAVHDFEVKRTVRNGYDPVGDQEADEVQAFTGRHGVFGSYSDKEIDGALIKSTDVRLTVLQANIDRRPQQSDVVAYSDGAFTIEAVAQDAASVKWRCQLRRT